MTPAAPPSDADEAALLDRARAGDRRALDDLLRLHQPRVYALCRRITGNDADALDATQEALIAVVRGLPGFDGTARLSTWVYRVATNACLDELRRRRRRPQAGFDDVADDPPEGASGAGHTGPADLVGDAVADRLDVDAALGLLPPDYRIAVVLRDLCTLDYAEIAAILEVPAGTVRSRIARGRAALARHLGGNQGPVAQRQTIESQKPAP